MPMTSAEIDDLSHEDLVSSLGTRWRLVTDQVMGGVSQGTLTRELVAGRPALRMRGDVSIENNGGFVQASLDLAPGGQRADASAWKGIDVDVYGNGEAYNLHLRTADLTWPWQSYRQGFQAPPEWRTVRLPFAEFQPYRTESPLNVSRLRRLGVVAIGRPFEADIAIGGVRFYA
ncbi:CIA30 family protein [Ferruginivarius sediminum]|uniref:CIA30 family protein n=1 Tax=Ferruginivarius sediminum TaxID=2661937 RepID=A0A369TIC7_9PROT|nr:CIA30 family protein [Ferruginivarius sediminum]RDD62636.1 CIA30 family protein [Ferruginivarius sediminum]